MPSEYKLEFRNISKAFPGVRALDNVSFGIRPGTVHVLAGENGAGKSTLMKIINGTYGPTGGEMLLNGETVRFANTREAIDHGIAMIHQELQYMPNMTVARYLMLCREPKKYGFINWKEVQQQADAILESQGMKFPLNSLVRELSVSDIQLLEITKTVTSDNIDVLIMDEPTSSLSDNEVDRLFKNIDRLKNMGITIIYISHKMSEIFQIADYVTVLRDGHHIKTASASEFTQASMIKMMVGREVSDIYPKSSSKPGDICFKVSHLTSSYSGLKNIALNVRAGEIVGIGGLMGAGRTETVRAIFGLDPVDSMEIEIEGKKCVIHSPKDAIKNGIVLATEDRRRNGLVLCRSILENASLPNLNQFSKFGFINKKKEKDVSKKYLERMNTKAASMMSLAQTLSGGNQQKVVLAKWLMTQPKVLILDEPTRGIDVGAKYEIYKIMVDLAQRGTAIIMISSELPEFIGMCDRCYVMSEGHITGELSKEEMTQTSIMTYATGGTL